MYKKDQAILINYFLKQWDLMKSTKRNMCLSLAQKQKIVRYRKEYYLKNGWRKATKRDLQKFTTNTKIRCFVSSCGCIGQLTKIRITSGYPLELYHAGHHNRIAYINRRTAKYIFEAGVAPGIFIRKVDFPK